jgi:hypothetical protein
MTTDLPGVLESPMETRARLVHVGLPIPGNRSNSVKARTVLNIETRTERLKGEGIETAWHSVRVIRHISQNDVPSIYGGPADRLR